MHDDALRSRIVAAVSCKRVKNSILASEFLYSRNWIGPLNLTFVIHFDATELYSSQRSRWSCRVKRKRSGDMEASFTFLMNRKKMNSLWCRGDKPQRWQRVTTAAAKYVFRLSPQLAAGGGCQRIQRFIVLYAIVVVTVCQHWQFFCLKKTHWKWRAIIFESFLYFFFDRRARSIRLCDSGTWVLKPFSIQSGEWIPALV